MKKVLVVGGAGYVGGITVDLLKQKGFDPTVYDNLTYEKRYLKPCNFIFGDVRDTDKLIKIQKKFDDIIWLAAIVGDGACSQNPELTKSVNVDSISVFLKKTRHRLIYPSTCSVYGAQSSILTEDSPTNPLSLYAYTKLEAEKPVIKYGGLVFRLGTLFGLGDHYSRIRLDLVVNTLTLNAFRQGRITVFGGEQWRPLLAVTDAAKYLVEAVNSNTTGILNLKFENATIAAIAKKIKPFFPGLKIELTNIQFEDSRNYKVDNTKSLKHFSHRPDIKPEDEIKKLVKVLKEGRIQNVNEDCYYNANHIKAMLYNHEI